MSLNLPEDKNLSLDDGVTKIFYNTEGYVGDLSKEAIALLRYIGSHKSNDDFVKRLDDQVEKARENEEWRIEYMTLLMRDQENREEGRQEGLAEGRKEIATTLINMKKYSPQEIAEITRLPIEEVEELAQVQPV